MALATEGATQSSAAGTRQGGVRWGQAWVAGTTNINDGNWHFVVISVSNGTKMLYCDGAVDPISSGASSWTGNGTGGQVRIGGAASGADSQVGFNGLIDELSLYTHALSDTEVRAIYNAGTAGKCTSFVNSAPTISCQPIGSPR